MRHLYLDDMSRNGGTNGKIFGGGVAMEAETLTYRNCGIQGRYASCLNIKDKTHDVITLTEADDTQKNKTSSKGKTRSKGAIAQEWYKQNRITSPNDADCYAQGTLRPQQHGSVHMAFVLAE